MNYYAIESNNIENGLYIYLAYSDELTYDPSKAYNFDTEKEALDFMEENNISKTDFHVQKMYKGE